jgi:hypothetical protein
MDVMEPPLTSQADRIAESVVALKMDHPDLYLQLAANSGRAVDCFLPEGARDE